eukprot:scaffold52276_cov23-Prasinocladus_malaysianus.AAC.1
MPFVLSDFTPSSERLHCNSQRLQQVGAGFARCVQTCLDGCIIRIIVATVHLLDYAVCSADDSRWVTYHWLEFCWGKGELFSPTTSLVFKPLEHRLPLPWMADVKCCASGYDEDQRTILRMLTKALDIMNCALPRYFMAYVLLKCLLDAP